MGNQPECPSPFPGVTELGKNDLARWENRECTQGKAAHPAFKTFIGKVKWKQQKSSWTQSCKKQNRVGRKVRAAVQKHQNAQLLLSKAVGRASSSCQAGGRAGQWRLSPPFPSFPPSEVSSSPPSTAEDSHTTKVKATENETPSYWSNFILLFLILKLNSWL